MGRESRSFIALSIIALTSSCGGTDSMEQIPGSTIQAPSAPTSNFSRTQVVGQNDKNTLALPPSVPSSDSSAVNVVSSLEGRASDSESSRSSEGGNADFTVTSYVWWLPWRGGGGGGGFDISCGPGQIAVGIYGRSGSNIDQIGLICSYVFANGNLSPATLTGTAGGNGGGPFYSQCPLGYGIIGFIGRSGAYVDRIGIVCGPISSTLFWYGPLYGGWGGGPWTDIVPSRYFVTRLVGRSGGYVDAIQAMARYVSP